MRIIALMNQKGGVGKTTTAANLGAALAELGRKVCLVDLDPQAHLTINYGVEPDAKSLNVYNLLCEETSFLQAMQRIDGNIALVPSSIDLAGAEVEMVSMISRELILRQRMQEAQHDFDFILVDCPPSLGLLTMNALAAATEVIIPMQPHFLALQGVGKLLETVALVNRRLNPALKVSGIVLTMFDSQTKLSNEVVNDLERFIQQAKGKPLPWANARIFQSKIRRNIKLAESPSFGQTILQYEPSSNGAADYRALAREVLELAGEKVEPARSEAVQAAASAAPAVEPTKREPADLKTQPASQPPPQKPQPAVSMKVENISPANLAAAKTIAKKTPPTRRSMEAVA